MLKLRITFFLGFPILLLPILVSAQSTLSDSSSTILHSYIEFALEKTKTAPGFAPPVAARAYGYLGLCTYEAAIIQQPNQPSFSEKLKGFQRPEVVKGKEYVWDIVANEALTQLIESLFLNLSETEKTELQLLREQFLANKKNIPATVMVRSKVHGRALAKSIFEYAQLDGGHEGQDNNYSEKFETIEEEGYWSLQNSQKALLPNWGANRLFFPPQSSNSVEILPPLSFSKDTSSAFYKAAADVHKKCLTVDYRQRATILYWKDGVGSYTPAGHSLKILNQLLKEEKCSALQVGRAYAIVGMTMSDAFIQSMRLKYRYQLTRPVDYIRNYIDPGFQTIVMTPSHPEFPSGHTTQIGAFSTLLNELLDVEYPFVDSSYTNSYAPRMYPSFEKMASEVADSRFLAGLHYKFSNEAGLDLGKATAQNALLFLQNIFASDSPLSLSNTTLPQAFFFQNQLKIKVRNYKSVDKIELKTITGQTVLSFTENLHTLDVSKYGGSHCKLVFLKENIELHSAILTLRRNTIQSAGVRKIRKPDPERFRQQQRN